MKQLKTLFPCLIALLSPTFAHAGDCGNLAMAAMFGYGGSWNNRPVVVNNFTPPYFAMHPPVYYGDRYYRPYGDSPYASWPQLQPNPAYSPRLQAPTSTGSMVLTIQNPHFIPVEPQLVPQYSAPIEPIAPQFAPQNSAPIDQTAPAIPPKNDQQPAKGKAPDVVKRRFGPTTIENPYYSNSTQFTSKK